MVFLLRILVLAALSWLIVIFLGLVVWNAVKAEEYQISIEGGWVIWPDTSNKNEVEADSSPGANVGLNGGVVLSFDDWTLGVGAGVNRRFNKVHGQNTEDNTSPASGNVHVDFIFMDVRPGLPISERWSVEAIGRIGAARVRVLGEPQFTYGVETGLGVKYRFEDWFVGLSGRYFRAGCTDHKGREACYDSYGPVLEMGVQF